MTETLANGYSSESTQWELSNEYQHDRVWMVIQNLGILVLWMKVASALEGLTFEKNLRKISGNNLTFLYQAITIIFHWYLHN